jgi:tRNA 5-methylaminomethyl-2-thiouridine biosynthesis bifunctional protein
VLDSRFDGGQRFVDLWNAWRADPQRCTHLCVISVSPAIALGLSLGDEASQASDVGRPADDSSRLKLRAEAIGCCAELRRQWPALTRNLHRLAFDNGRVQWLLLAQPLDAGLRLLRASIDVFSVATVDDASAAVRTTVSADAESWRRLVRSIARLAVPGALLHAPALGESDHACRALASAGFEPTRDRARISASDCDLGRDRDTSVHDGARPMAAAQAHTDWHYAPRFTPRRPAADPWRSNARPNAPVAVIGAGLAGCAMAWALAEQGIACHIFDTHESPAQEASGNLAGLFHGIVHPQDGAHARLHRAAALEAKRAVSVTIGKHPMHGSTSGLLRLEFAQSLPDMRALLDSLSLPASYAQACSPADASAISGLQIESPAWWYPGGGWVQPTQLCRSYLDRAGTRAMLQAHRRVASLSRRDGAWRLLGADGVLMAESPVVVLANAGDAVRLLGNILPSTAHDACPMQRVRGQVSVADASRWPSLSTLKVPIAGRGYLVQLPDGRLLFGATAQIDDCDASVRADDHLANLVQLSRLTGESLERNIIGLDGRTAWRWSTPDRLPLLGPVPDVEAAAGRGPIERTSQVPRVEGLYLCSAFGSRGIAWSALSAQIVASAISGAPLPLEADLLDSVDAARFVCGRSKRQHGRAGAKEIGNAV